ncbi:ATP-dependent nuclease [Exiguobacterium acetylicum]|uniref:ATP-dependent nuclease n=1 Tax=Exiguobacterium acetylicum TaxID=41170 RepID=UPI001CA6BB5C|nr:AAA family ATPase [Exiguobacterium acetylicum]QZY88641.1 AAA family ATPase [Exiguobacterium acetylicum]
MTKKSTKIESSLVSQDPNVPKPRLSKLSIKNFRCIGNDPVEIELDDIVVLVGSNNAGKSTILKAYELAMSQGSNASKLTIKDFPNEKVDSERLPEIEIHTIVYDNSPGDRWIHVDKVSNEKLVKEKWTWHEVGAPVRRGFDVTLNTWSDNVPWGAPNVANSYRPQPHLVEAFEDPEKQSKEITQLLSSIINERVKSVVSKDDNSDYDKMLSYIKETQAAILDDTKSELQNAEDELSSIIGNVFPGYRVTFDAKPLENIEDTINFFDPKSDLMMGPQDGHRSTIARQGSGARRTLLWAALRFINETKLSKKKKTERPNILLLDEPELCLHPNAVREACKSLYDLPENRNWQVMVTTHSPAFIDLSRDNTTIVRVSRNESGGIQGTTLFRPEKAKLSAIDKEQLKLLNIFDPYVAEFFFGGHTVIVEGDTEYTAFKYIVDSDPSNFKDVHIVRARGKATIVSLVKILNHFNSKYSVLHDSDHPFTSSTKKSGDLTKNPAWTINKSILDAVNQHSESSHVRLLASIPNFEEAYFEQAIKKEKPYNAFLTLKDNPAAFNKVRDVLTALIHHDAIIPDGCIEWSDLDDLSSELQKKGHVTFLSPI